MAPWDGQGAVALQQLGDGQGALRADVVAPQHQRVHRLVVLREAEGNVQGTVKRACLLLTRPPTKHQQSITKLWSYRVLAEAGFGICGYLRATMIKEER